MQRPKPDDRKNGGRLPESSVAANWQSSISL